MLESCCVFIQIFTLIRIKSGNFPDLQQTGSLLQFQNEFLWAYEQNFDKVGDRDFLPLFGAGIINYLYDNTPPEKRLLVKVPSVQYLSRFYEVFPHENLLVLVRDGRDLVHSTLRTWPQLNFYMVSLRYKRAAEMILSCDQHFSKRPNGYLLNQFENLFRDPAGFVHTACKRFGLDPDTYPYDRINQIQVRGSSQKVNKGSVSWDGSSKTDQFSPIGHWLEWSRYRKWLFKRVAGQALIKLGYAKDSTW